MLLRQTHLSTLPQESDVVNDDPSASSSGRARQLTTNSILAFRA